MTHRNVQADKKTSRSGLMPWVYALIAIAPLVFAVPPISSIRVSAFGYLFPSQIILTMLGCAVLFCIFCCLGRCADKRYVRQLVFVIAVLFVIGLYGCTRGIGQGYAMRSLVDLLWLAAPIMYAEMLGGILIKNRVRLVDVAVRMIYSITLFSAAVIVCNVLFYGEGVRLYIPGLGSVVFGYTLVVMLAFAVFVRALGYCSKVLSACALLFVVACVFTESRAAVYPAIMLCSVYFCINSNRGFNVIPVVLVGLALLIVNPIEVLTSFSDRFGRLDSNRFDTWFASMEAVFESNALDVVFGHGLGNVFPYYDWYTDLYTGAIQRDYTDGAWNQFVFQGHVMLVEPHNTFIWVMLEMGITGLALLIICFLRIAKVSGTVYAMSGRSMKPYAFVLVLSVMFISMFDAVIFVNVASAVIWICLLIAFSMASESQKGHTSSE